MSQFFASGGQSIGASASASVLPMNTQVSVPPEWAFDPPYNVRDHRIQSSGFRSHMKKLQTQDLPATEREAKRQRAIGRKGDSISTVSPPVFHFKGWF